MYTFSDALSQFCFIILSSCVGEKRIKTDRVSAVLKLKHVIPTLYKQKRVTDHLALFALTYLQCNWAMLLAVLLMVHPPQQAIFLAVTVHRKRYKDGADSSCYIGLHPIFCPLNEEALKRVGEREQRKQASSYSSELPALCQWRWGEGGKHQLTSSAHPASLWSTYFITTT